MHKIELKNIKIAEFLSEETTAFTADIFVDGKKVGYAKNDGCGGCTFYHGNSREENDLLDECNAELMKSPKQKNEQFGFEFQPNLEYLLDDLLEEYLKAKAEKKMLKAMETAILCERPNGYVEYFWTRTLGRKKERVRLKDIAPATIKVKIDELKKSGEKILNTNIKV